MATLHTNGTPWCYQNEFNTSQSGTLASWSNHTSYLPESCSAPGVFQLKDKVYYAGGISNTGTFRSGTFRTIIDNTGYFSVFTTFSSVSKSLGTAVYDPAVIVTKDHVHLIGGVIAGYSGTNKIQSIGYDSVGDLTTWYESGTLPAGRYAGRAIVINNYVHYIGGMDNSLGEVDTCLYAPINDDGTLGSWSYGEAMPGIAQGHALIRLGNKIYVGGLSTTAMYEATIQPSGMITDWIVSSKVYPVANLKNSAVLTTAGCVLIYGGSTGSATSYQLHNLLSSGDLNSTWTNLYNAGSAFKYGTPVITRDLLYILGPDTNSTNVAVKYSGAQCYGGLTDYTDKIYTVTNSGIITPPLDIVEGTATAGSVEPVSGDGIVEALLESINGYGSSSLVRTGTGAISAPKDHVKGYAYPDISRGIVTEKIHEVQGYISSHLGAYGDVVPRRHIIQSAGYSHYNTIYGDIREPVVEVSGSARSANVGFGSITPLLDTVAGATTIVVSGNSGSVVPKLDKVSGLIVPSSIASGLITDTKHVIHGTAETTSYILGVIVEPTHRIQGRIYGSRVQEVLDFDRDPGETPSTTSAYNFDTLEFNRDLPERPTLESTGAEILEFHKY